MRTFTIALLLANMTQKNIGIAFICFFFICGQVCPQNLDSLCRAENRWALIIIADVSPNDHEGRYDHEGQDGQSALSVEDSLRSGLVRAGFPREQIIALTPRQREPLLMPTLRNIREQLQWVRQPETNGPLPGQRPIRQFDEACEVFVYIQMLGIRHEEGQYLSPLTENGTSIPPDEVAGLLPVSEVSDALARSTVERRLLVMNIQSPAVTRGTSAQRTHGIHSQTLLREVPVALAGFGQVIVNDQISTMPGNINSFTDIFLRGLSGYADRSLQGNWDTFVTLRELVEYLEHYGNMASAGAVSTMLLGHDYPIASVTQPVSKSVADTGTQRMLERVGSTLLNLRTGNHLPDNESAVESFQRAAGSRPVFVQPSRTATISSERAGRGRALHSSDSLRLLEYDRGWFRVESGWINASSVDALRIAER